MSDWQHNTSGKQLEIGNRKLQIPPTVRPSTMGLFSEIVCGMSTRIGGVSPAPLSMNTGLSVGDDEVNVMENRRLFCDALGFSSEQLATQHQVHGDSCSVVRGPCHIDANDALITNVPGVFLAVGVADCQPIMMYDRANKVVAGVHAGWRGAAAHIAAKTLQRMIAEFGTSQENVWVFVGPCASACCYEVDSTVAMKFDKAFYVEQSNGSHVTHKSYGTDATGNKYLLDLKASTKSELQSAGVPAMQIETSPCCTICMPEYFHSHRRDSSRSGRMMAIIGIHS